MGLSVQSQKEPFLALNQMMSKGTIQAEELRGVN
jgi:tape measure domain-containing protein